MEENKTIKEELDWFTLFEKYPNAVREFAKWYYHLIVPGWLTAAYESSMLDDLPESLSREDWRCLDGYLNSYFFEEMNINVSIEKITSIKTYINPDYLVKQTTFKSYNHARYYVYNKAFSVIEEPYKTLQANNISVQP